MCRDKHELIVDIAILTTYRLRDLEDSEYVVSWLIANNQSDRLAWSAAYGQTVQYSIVLQAHHTSHTTAYKRTKWAGKHVIMVMVRSKYVSLTQQIDPGPDRFLALTNDIILIRNQILLSSSLMFNSSILLLTYNPQFEHTTRHRHPL